MSTNRSAKQELLAAGERVYREYLTAMILHGQAAAEVLDLHPTDLYGLNVLGVAGPLTAGQLAQQTGLTTGAATRLIDRLEGAGYVRRRRDPSDRRRVIVEAVPERAQQIQQAFEPARRRLGEVFASYRIEQLQTLFDYFARATPALRDATTEMREAARGKHSRTPSTG